MNYSDKVKLIREKWNLTQDQLADALQIDRSYLSQIENGRRTPSIRLQSHIEQIQQYGLALNVAQSTLLVTLRKIPVVSWSEAENMATIEIESLKEQFQENVPTDCPDPNAFALKIHGDSMMPEFREGDIAVLMPSESPRIGLPVFANLKNEGIVFRVFNYIGVDREVYRLTCLNPTYPPLDVRADELHWIYPVHSVNKKIWR